MTIEQELDYAYNLVSEKYKVNFLKPSLYLGDENFPRFIERLTIKDEYLKQPVPTIYLYQDVTNSIFVPTCYKLDLPDPIKASIDKIFSLSHEIAHSLIHQTNPKFKSKDIEDLKAGGDPEYELGETLSQFDEGMASYVSIDCCQVNNNIDLKNEALSWKTHYKACLDYWISTCKSFSRDENWQDFTKRQLFERGGADVILRYTLGYYYICEYENTGVIELINNPPLNFDAILNLK